MGNADLSLPDLIPDGFAWQPDHSNPKQTASDAGLTDGKAFFYVNSHLVD